MKKKYKKIKSWSCEKTTTQLKVYQLKLRSKLNQEQDTKNNKLVYCDYNQPANNNWKLYTLGCVSVNMNNQPYQPTVVKRSK